MDRGQRDLRAEFGMGKVEILGRRAEGGRRMTDERRRRTEGEGQRSDDVGLKDSQRTKRSSKLAGTEMIGGLKLVPGYYLPLALRLETHAF